MGAGTHSDLKDPWATQREPSDPWVQNKHDYRCHPFVQTFGWTTGVNANLFDDLKRSCSNTLRQYILVCRPQQLLFVEIGDQLV